MYFNIPDYMFLLKRKMLNAVLLYEDGRVTDYIVFEHITKTNIVAIYSESNQYGENINLLISEIQKLYKKQPVFLHITDTEDACEYKKIGFAKVGHLKKEVESSVGCGRFLGRYNLSKASPVPLWLSASKQLVLKILPS